MHIFYINKSAYSNNEQSDELLHIATEVVINCPIRGTRREIARIHTNMHIRILWDLAALKFASVMLTSCN